MESSYRQPALETIQTLDMLDEVITRSQEQPVLLYKHSLTCGLSTTAKREVFSLSRADDPPIYEIVVQRARPVSNAVEQRFGIRHESPQVLLVDKGRVIHHASHWRIKADAVRQAMTERNTV